MVRNILIVVGVVSALAVLLAAGVLEGIRTNRWGATEDLQAAATRLKAIPREVGDWMGTDLWIEPKLLERAEATGYVSRQYRNPKTGATVSTLLLCGPPGPIGAHTPDYCYGGLGYQLTGKERRKTVAMPDGKTAAYWSVQFVKPDSTQDPGLEVNWAWGVDGDWVASRQPRQEFISHQFLYKFYVARALTAADHDGRVPPDTVREFLSVFLPAIQATLVPGGD